MTNDKETRNLMARLEKLEQMEAQNAKALAEVKAENEQLRGNQKLGKALEYRTGRSKSIGNIVITERETLFENGVRETVSLQERYFHRESKTYKLGRSQKFSRGELNEVIGFFTQLRDGTPTYSADGEASTSTESSTVEDYMKLTRSTLIDLCKSKGLPCGGNKTDLSTRLVNGAPSEPSKPDGIPDIVGQLAGLSAADLLAFVASKQQ